MYEQHFNPYSANIDIVKGYFKSGKVLTLGILYFVNLALSVLTLLTTSSSSAVYEYLDYLNSLGIDTSDINYYSDSFLSGANTGAVLSAVISSVFTILTAVAFIIIYSKSRSANPMSNPVGGVSILRVLSVITFVFTIILTVLTVIAFMIIVLTGKALVYGILDGGDDKNVATVFVVAGIILTSFLVILIAYVASYKNFYGSVKLSLSSIQLQNKGAAAYGVFNIIFAVFTGLSFISTSVLTFSTFSISSLLSFLSSAVSFVILIMNASLALGYSKYINRQMTGYNNTPYGASGAPYPNGFQSYNMPPRGGDPAYNDNYNDFNNAAQDAPSFCPNCGAPADPSAPFCPNCGAKL